MVTDRPNRWAAADLLDALDGAPPSPDSDHGVRRWRRLELLEAALDEAERRGALRFVAEMATARKGKTG